MTRSLGARQAATYAAAQSLLALLTLVAAPSLGAQATTPQDSTAQRLAPAVVRAARGATVIGGASAVVVQVDSTRGAIAPTLADVLRSVPMVLVRTNSRGEAELSVRGSESRQVGILLNGLPLSPGWDGRADPSLIPLTGVSSVSYVRSTATVLGGPNTLGGVIDLSFDDTAMSARQLSLGSDQTGARLVSGSASASRVRPASSLSWRVGAGVRQRDGLVRAADVPDPAGTPNLRTNTDAREYDLLGSLAWRARNGAALSALVSGYEAQRGVAPELHVAGPRYWRYPEQSRRLVQVQAHAPRLTSALGTTELQIGGGVLQGTTHIETFADANYAPVDGTEGGEELVTTARVGVTQTLPIGAQLKAAFTANTVEYDETLNGAAPLNYLLETQSAGLETNVLFGGRTLVSGGVVVDRSGVVRAGGKEPLAAKSLFGWRVGTTHPLGDAVRLHASASSRARFAALRELYSGAVNRFEPNPALKPERLLATEAGVSFGEADGSAGLNAQVTAFHHWLQDGIVRVGYMATNRFQRINRDETRTAGVEALVGWNRGANGGSLTLDLVAQRVQIRDQIAGDDRKPEHMPNVRAMLDGTLPSWRGITLGANLSHIGNQYCVHPDTDTDVALRGKTLTGVTVHRNWRFHRGGFRAMRVVAGIDNVTNAALYEQCGLPRAGRTLRLGIDLR